MGAPNNSSGSKWTCTVCTYAGTPRHLLRCEICDTPRLGPLSVARSSGGGKQPQQEKRKRALGEPHGYRRGTDVDVRGPAGRGKLAGQKRLSDC